MIIMLYEFLLIKCNLFNDHFIIIILINGLYDKMCVVL